MYNYLMDSDYSINFIQPSENTFKIDFAVNVQFCFVFVKAEIFKWIRDVRSHAIH